MTKSKILSDFSDLLIRKFESEATIKTYYNCAKKFINSNHIDTIDKLSNDYLLKWITEFKKINSISFYNQMCSVLKLIYNELLNQKKLKEVKLIKQYPKLKNLPDIKEVFNKANSIDYKKHKAIILTLLFTGARISELLNIKLSNINRNSMRIIIEKGKGGSSGFVLINDFLLKVLEDYYIEFKPKEYLFEGLNGKYSKSSVNKIIKKYIGEKYSAHWMRHLAITYIINNKFSLPQAKLFSRHLSNSSIEYYYHYDESLHNELRSCISELAA